MFKKGDAYWQGKKRSPEDRKKMSLSHLGHPAPKSAFKKGFTPWNKGKPHSEETKRKMLLARQGRKLTPEHKRNIGLASSKEKHWAWKGGISFNPYPKAFNKELKLKIRTRDNFICRKCGRTEREELEELNRVLCVNHIDFDKNNLKESNLNTLCTRCNIAINRERDYWTNYFQTNE